MFLKSTWKNLLRRPKVSNKRLKFLETMLNVCKNYSADTWTFTKGQGCVIEKTLRDLECDPTNWATECEGFDIREKEFMRIYENYDFEIAHNGRIKAHDIVGKYVEELIQEEMSNA